MIVRLVSVFLIVCVILASTWAFKEAFMNIESAIEMDALTASLRYPHAGLVHVDHDRPAIFMVLSKEGQSLYEVAQDTGGTLRVRADSHGSARYIFERLVRVLFRQRNQPYKIDYSSDSPNVTVLYAEWDVLASQLSTRSLRPVDYTQGLSREVAAFLFPPMKLDVVSVMQLGAGVPFLTCLVSPMVILNLKGKHQTRDYLQVVFKEPFENSKLHMQITEDIPTDMVEQIRTVYRVLRVRRDATPDLKLLKSGDRVILRNQFSMDRNGSYIVSEENDSHLLLTSAVLLEARSLKLVYDPHDRTFAFSTEPLAHVLSDFERIFFKDLDRPAMVMGRGPTPRTYHFKLFDDTKNDIHEFNCATNPEYVRVAECVSPYDPYGNLKKEGRDVWDKRCESNDECPFYKANKRYPNDRGGCVSGSCEMPLGVTRRGYRFFVAEEAAYHPMCHGCPDPTDVFCCAQQESPDYAFADDLVARRNHGL